MKNQKENKNEMLLDNKGKKNIESSIQKNKKGRRKELEKEIESYC